MAVIVRWVGTFSASVGPASDQRLLHRGMVNFMADHGRMRVVRHGNAYRVWFGRDDVSRQFYMVLL